MSLPYAFSVRTETMARDTGGDAAAGSRVLRVATQSDRLRMVESVHLAVEAMLSGEPVVILDSDRSKGALLAYPAATITAAQMGLLIRHTSGLVAVGMTKCELDRLGIPRQAGVVDEDVPAQYFVSVDASGGVSTGISGRDRARTARLLASATTMPYDLTRPGHVLPVLVDDHGVLAHPGAREASFDLCRLAGIGTTAVFSQIVEDSGELMSPAAAREFAATNGFAFLEVDQLLTYRRTRERRVRPLTEPSTLDTKYGRFEMRSYVDADTGTTQWALVKGLLDSVEQVPVAVHSECVAGNVFSSVQCSCSDELSASLEFMSEQHHGVVLYFGGSHAKDPLTRRRAERSLEDGQSADRVDLQCDVQPDVRDYETAAHILADMGSVSVRLIAEDPEPARLLAQAWSDVRSLRLEGHRSHRD